MKLISKLSMIVVMMAMFAFTGIEPTDIVGKYGEKESTKMEMSFLENGEFTFVDNSNEESPVTVNGKWSADNNVITLSDFGDANISDTWRFDEDRKAISSRKGMTFYRLANCDKAKACCSKDKAKTCDKDKK